MKKKLFVWYYKHNNHVCALDEDGKMIYLVISDEDANTTIKSLFTENPFILDKYDLEIQDQDKLERHVYGGESRDLIPKSFQVAWDKYKGIEYSPS